MKISRFIASTAMIFCACALSLFPISASARSVSTGTSLVESRLNGDTILGASKDKLLAAVTEAVKANPGKAGKIVEAVLAGGRADADALAALVVTTAIQALGPNPPEVDVSDIVYAAVKATPAVVLDIVKAAVKADPNAAKAVVRAAVKGVPNSTDKIAGPSNNNMPPSDFGYTKDDKDMLDADNSQDPLMPIGEAIAEAAHQADPAISTQDFLTTVNQVQHDPGFTTVSAYRGYYYPPDITVLPTPAPSAPVAPVVSK